MSLISGIDQAIMELIRQMDESADSEFTVEVKVKRSYPLEEDGEETAQNGTSDGEETMHAASSDNILWGAGSARVSTIYPANSVDYVRPNLVNYPIVSMGGGHGGGGGEGVIHVTRTPPLGTVSTVEMLKELQARFRVERSQDQLPETESALNMLLDAIVNGLAELPSMVLIYRTVDS